MSAEVAEDIDLPNPLESTGPIRRGCGEGYGQLIADGYNFISEEDLNSINLPVRRLVERILRNSHEVTGFAVIM